MELYKSKDLTITESPIVSRAIEIAETSQVKLLIISNEHLLKQLESELVSVEPPCPCGYHGSVKTKCVCSAEKIEKHIYMLKRKYDGRLSVEAVFTYHRNVSVKLQGMSQSLMKQAYAELSLSLSQVVVIMQAARTIATMDKSEHIKPEHLAEAISYRLPHTA